MSSNRNEIILAARKASCGDVEMQWLLSDAMACESDFGMVCEVLEMLRRFPQTATVKERGGNLLVTHDGVEYSFDELDKELPWLTPDQE